MNSKRADSKPNSNNKFIFITIFLLISNFLVSLSIIYVRHINRTSMAELQKLVSDQNNLYQEWTQLLLEQSTFTSYNRVDKIANQNLNMHFPTWKETKLIKVGDYNSRISLND